MGIESGDKRPDYYIFHPWDPVKYEPPELIRTLYILEERVKHMEEYLVAGSKQAFVRAAERGPVDSQTEILHSLNTRLEALEKKLGATSKG
jgi:hypothetical protein